MRPLILVAGSVTSAEYKEMRVKAMREAKANGMKPPIMRHLIMATSSWRELENPRGNRNYEQGYLPNSYNPNVMMVKGGHKPVNAHTGEECNWHNHPSGYMYDLVVEHDRIDGESSGWFDQRFFESAVDDLDSWLRKYDLDVYGFVSAKRLVGRGFYRRLLEHFPDAHQVIVEPLPSLV